MKIVMWISFVLSQMILVFLIFWLGINTNITESGSYFVGFMIATYGSLQGLGALFCLKCLFDTGAAR